MKYIALVVLLLCASAVMKVEGQMLPGSAMPLQRSSNLQSMMFGPWSMYGQQRSPFRLQQLMFSWYREGLIDMFDLMNIM